jgi:hypothetical protein
MASSPFGGRNSKFSSTESIKLAMSSDDKPLALDAIQHGRNSLKIYANPRIPARQQRGILTAHNLITALRVVDW